MFEQHLREWKKKYYTEQMIEIAKELPVRRDMVTLLKFVNENKVVGTQSTGNMPLKMVRAVTTEFVNPPVLDKTIGDRTHRLRSEEDIWPLYFLHKLAEVALLLEIAPARRWRLTGDGKRFLDVDALRQVTFMMSVWWYEINWIVAYPYSGMGAALPPFFSYITMEELLTLPENEKITFGEFADKLIVSTGITWDAPDSTIANELLQSSIERMVINILKKFGAVECEYRDEPLGKGTISKLQTFKIAPFGRAILESLTVMSR